MTFRRAAVVVAVALALTSCSKGGEPSAEDIAPHTAFSKNVSPLTGLKITAPDRPVYYVKIENTNGGEPQYGEHQADMMIEELVEDGATRAIGLFYSQLPNKIGHVRSARTTDIALAQPVNAAIIASGSAEKTREDILDSKTPFYVWDWRDGDGWSEDPDKVAPYHVLLDLQKMDAAVKRTPGPTKNYFDWGTGPAEEDVTKTVTSARVKFSSKTTTSWSFSGGKWKRSPERAAPGQEFKTDTVVVIFAKVVEAGYNDKSGNPVPETVVEGSGRAVLFIGNKAVEATWHKKDPKATMTFTSKNGNPVRLKPGHIWLEAVPRGGDVTY